MNAQDEERYRILLAAAVLSDPLHGEWAFETWKSHNEFFFDGSLSPVPIIFGLIPHGRALSYFDGKYGRILLHQSLVEPHGTDPWKLGKILGKRLASDVILHECIRQKVWSIYRLTGRESSHNNQHFVDQVNRIAPLLGLEVNATVIRQRNVHGRTVWENLPEFLSRSELSLFPYGVRPPGYFEEEAEVLLEKLVHIHRRKVKDVSDAVPVNKNRLSSTDREECST